MPSVHELPTEIPFLPIINNTDISKNVLSINEQFILNKISVTDSIQIDHEFIKENFNHKKYNKSIFNMNNLSQKKLYNNNENIKNFLRKLNTHNFSGYNNFNQENEITGYIIDSIKHKSGPNIHILLKNNVNIEDKSIKAKKFLKSDKKQSLFTQDIIQEDIKEENIIKEDKFFLTRSRINKNTQINITKVFFPEKFKRKPNLSLENVNDSFDPETKKLPYKINFHSVKNEKKYPKTILNPIKKQNNTIYSKNDFTPIKNNLTISLNNELSKISSVYGKEHSFKKFTDNPITNKFYEERNYLGYEIAKMNEFRDIHIKPKLKPLIIPKGSTLNKLTESLFNIKELEPKNDLNDYE